MPRDDHTIEHPHPFFNGLTKSFTTIKHRDGSEFEMAYYVTKPPENVAPTGQRVLCLQGFLAPGAPWRATANDLAAHGHEVLAYDHCGIGHSTFPDSQPFRMTTKRYANHVRQLLDNVWGNGTSNSFPPFHVVGLSMGGMITLELTHWIMTHAPHKLKSLTLVSTHPGGLKNKFPPLNGIWTVFAGVKYRHDMRARAERVMVPSLVHPKHQKVVHENGVLGAEKARDYFVAAWQSHPVTPLRPFLSQALAVFTHHVSEERLKFIQERMQGPIFVTTGDVDSMVRPSNSYYLAKVLKARFHQLQHCGHAVFLQEKDFCVQQILRQIREGAHVGEPAAAEDNDAPGSPGTLNAKSLATDSQDVDLVVDTDVSTSVPSTERTPLLLNRALD